MFLKVTCYSIGNLVQPRAEMLTPNFSSTPVDSTSVHLLSYPFLFPPTHLLASFRAINHAAMFKAYNSSILFKRVLSDMSYARSGRDHVRLNKTLANFFILEVSRSDILTDALNQLWRRERREMLKPLRVRLGAHEGEEGEDLGGVQQEFFRVAIGEALKRDYGKKKTLCSWFPIAEI